MSRDTQLKRNLYATNYWAPLDVHVYLRRHKIGHTFDKKMFGVPTLELLTDLRGVDSLLPKIFFGATSSILSYGIPCLDYTRGMKVCIDYVLKTPNSITVNRGYKTVMEYVNSCCYSSALSEAETVILSIKDTSFRKRISLELMKYLKGELTVVKLQTICGLHEYSNELLSVLPKLDTLRLAIQHSKISSVKEASSKFRVSEFDINFVLAERKNEHEVSV